jgi:biofilm PGA synthesis protein PgaA
MLLGAVILGGVLAIEPAGSSRAAATATATETAPVSPWLAEQNRAVRLARQGDTSTALPILDRLHREHPEDAGIARDFTVVTAWAGRDGDAIRLYLALPPGPQPDYVLEPIALAYRHTGQPAAALALYRQGLLRSPDNAQFTAGIIRCDADLGHADEAVALAESDLHAHGERVDVLLAAGYAASAQKKLVDALRYVDRAVKLAPANAEARHDRIIVIDDMGAPQVARQLADQNPGLLSAAENRRIDGDAAAALVRWGVLEPPSEALRFAATDRAIAALDALIARWSRDGDAARGDILRARFDRMVALRDRVRMVDVVAEYEDLERNASVIPGYALDAAADAYLYLRHPEQARDLYLRCLQQDPHNPEIRVALFYAYVDLDDFDAAFHEIDNEAADQAIWFYLKGLNEPVENPDRAGADLAAGEARLYADELAEANRRVAAMADQAPNNTAYLSALANVYSARGWPRRAAQEYLISRALKPEDVATETGQARNDLDLREYREVEAALANLKQRFPENLEVRRLDRLWQVHNMAEFSLSVEQTLGSATSVQGGTGIAIDSQLYSPPVDYNWRVFAQEYASHEILPLGEGAVMLRRSGIGAEYRDRNVVASLEGTANAYGPHIDPVLDSGIDSGRGGARALVTWSVNDHWQVGGGAELFALDTPLRALGNGITANSASANVTYRESESREVSLDGEAMKFSDGDLRSSLDGTYTERLSTQPHLTVDGILGLAESHNSADSNRPYFNPRQDMLASYGVSINQVIYRRYEFIYDHHLVITPGAYWEQGFGTGGAGSVLYEQRLRANDVFETGLGVTLSRQPYDGTYDNTVALLFNMRLRF